MKNLLNRLRERKKRRAEKHPAKWAETRKKGRGHYISGVALFYSLAMTGWMTIVKLLFGESINIIHVALLLPFMFVAGGVIGLFTWRSNEKEFLKYRSNRFADDPDTIRGRSEPAAHD